MTVSDQHVAALRSFLADGYEVWLHNHQELINSGNAEGYGLLVHAAFTRAAFRKFSPSWSLPDVIRFIGEVRANVVPYAQEIDALTAENLLRQAIGDESLGADALSGVDVQAVASVEGILLQAMVRETALDEVGLEEFIKDATIHANKWLATRRAESFAQDTAAQVFERGADVAAERGAGPEPSRGAGGNWEAS